MYNKLQLLTKAFEHDDNLTKLSPKILNIILQNKDNDQFLGELENAIEQTCTKQSGGSSKDRFQRQKLQRMTKVGPPQFSKKNSSYISQTKLAEIAKKEAETRRDNERRARQKLQGIETTENNIGNVLIKSMNDLLKKKAKEINFIKQDFKKLNLIQQIEFIDSFNSIIENIDTIEDTLIDVFQKKGEIVFNEHNENLIKTLQNVNKQFKDTPFENAFAKTITSVRDSWLAYSWKSMNIGKLFGSEINIPLPTWERNTLTIVDNEAIIKAINDLGPHINQYENEAADETILNGLINRRQQAIFKKIQSITNPDYIPPFINQVEGWMEDEVAQQVVKESLRKRESETPKNMRTRLKTVRLDTGKLIDAYDYGASVVPEVVNQGKRRIGGVPEPAVYPPPKGKKSSAPKLIGEFDHGASIVPEVVNQGKRRNGGVPGPSVYPPTLFRPTKSMVLLIGQYKVSNPYVPPNYFETINKAEQLNVMSFDRCVNDFSLILVLLQFIRKLYKRPKIRRKIPKSAAKISSPKTSAPRSPSPSRVQNNGVPFYKRKGALNMTRPNANYNFLNDPNAPGSSSPSPRPINYSSSENQAMPSQMSHPPVRRVKSAPGVLPDRPKVKSNKSSSEHIMLNQPAKKSSSAIVSHKQNSNLNKNSGKLLIEYTDFVNLCKRAICSIDLYREFYVTEVTDVQKQLDKINMEKQTIQFKNSYANKIRQKEQERKLDDRISKLNEYIQYLQDDDETLLNMIKDIEDRKLSPDKSSFDSIKTHTQQLKIKYNDFINDSRCDKEGGVKANLPKLKPVPKKIQIKSRKLSSQLSKPTILSRKRSSSPVSAKQDSRRSSASASASAKVSSQINSTKSISNSIKQLEMTLKTNVANQNNEVKKLINQYIRSLKQINKFKSGINFSKNKEVNISVACAIRSRLIRIRKALIEYGINEDVLGPIVFIKECLNIKSKKPTTNKSESQLKKQIAADFASSLNNMSNRFNEMRQTMNKMLAKKSANSMSTKPSNLTSKTNSSHSQKHKKSKPMRSKKKVQSTKGKHLARVAQARKEAAERSRQQAATLAKKK